MGADVSQLMTAKDQGITACVTAPDERHLCTKLKPVQNSTPADAGTLVLSQPSQLVSTSQVRAREQLHGA